jgi:hypothetical protein
MPGHPDDVGPMIALLLSEVALCHLREIAMLLEQPGELAAFLAQKIDAAQIHKNPYFKPLSGTDRT